MPDVNLSPADLAQLAERGVTEAEARRQLALLASRPAYARLARAATAGDGIETLGATDAAESAARAAAAAGRVTQFVPASGAASRMFKELLAALAEGHALTRAAIAADRAANAPDGDALARFADGLERFAFRDALGRELEARGESLAALIRSGDFRPAVRALLEADGLDFGERPKGLLPFHRVDGEVRTAFEEHLREAAWLSRDHHGRCRLHFTVSPAHRAGFEAELAAVRARLEPKLGVRFDVAFSEQKPSTDTLAATLEGEPFRDDSGRLLFRPAGHGALIENLADLGADLVFVKNVDNVAVERLAPETLRWARALVGETAALSDAARAAVLALERGDDAARAPARALAARFGRAPSPGLDPVPERAALAAALDRPLRVCAMVPNTGEPGGGPFWVEDEGGARLQIVESAEVDPEDAAARALFRRGTHFNPVFFAAALRDAHGAPHDLARFVDPAAAIFTRKSHGGRELLAMERPGLWNGAMRGWNTVFVEAPLAIFNPVKTVLDLLRPEHQG